MWMPTNQFVTPCIVFFHKHFAFITTKIKGGIRMKTVTFTFTIETLFSNTLFLRYLLFDYQLVNKTRTESKG